MTARVTLPADVHQIDATGLVWTFLVEAYEPDRGEVVDGGGDLLGHLVSMASRVTGAAEGGEILVTETVADLAPPRSARSTAASSAGRASARRATSSP